MAYPKPAFTVDIVFFCWRRSQIQLLLIKRKKDPFKEKWALPGGFVDKDEAVAKAAQRELEEETGYSISTLVPLGIFDEAGRDPRGWTMSVAFWTIVQNPKATRPGSDAIEAKWFPLKKLPELAFDHDKIISKARSLIRNYTENARHLLDGVGDISVANLKAVLEGI